MRRKHWPVLVLGALLAMACDGDDGRPGEISMSVTVLPSGSPGSGPSESPSKSPSLKGDGKGEKNDKPELVRVPGGATLFDLPERAAAICAQGLPLSKACPSLVPAIQKNRSYLVDSFGRPGGRFQVLELAAGATTGDFGDNAPPAVSHLVVEVAKQLYLTDLGTPLETRSPIDSLLATERPGSYRVFPEKGWKWDRPLILAESFPGGGAHGDHLIYEWQEGARTYRVSLHVWTPAVEAVRTLHAIVKSIKN